MHRLIYKFKVDLFLGTLVNKANASSYKYFFLLSVKGEMKGDKRTVALLQEKIPRSSSLTSSEMSDNVSWILEFTIKGLKILLFKIVTF